jgi:hypothetical protein
MHAEFFLVGMKAQQDKGSRRILLDGKTGSRVVMLWPIRFQCVGVGFQLECLVCTHIIGHTCTECHLAQHLTCARTCRMCMSRSVCASICSVMVYKLTAVHLISLFAADYHKGKYS